jgi:antitoxin component YwqK of YwqJK toxin-antitoxin module
MIWKYMILFLLFCGSTPGFGEVRMTYWPNGQLQTEEEVKGGKQEGITRRYSKEGKLYAVVNYHNGVMSGPSQLFRSNGQVLADGTMKDGKFDGPLKVYSKSGKLVLTLVYRNGVPISSTSSLPEAGKDFSSMLAD